MNRHFYVFSEVTDVTTESDSCVSRGGILWVQETSTLQGGSWKLWRQIVRHPIWCTKKLRYQTFSTPERTGTRNFWDQEASTLKTKISGKLKIPICRSSPKAKIPGTEVFRCQIFPAYVSLCRKFDNAASWYRTRRTDVFFLWDTVYSLRVKTPILTYLMIQ